MKAQPRLSKVWTFKAIIKDRDNWARYQQAYAGQVRADQVAEIEKMLGCGEATSGFARYSCLHGGETLRFCFSCKSRVCSRCGKVYADEWAQHLTSHLLKVIHRPSTFTVRAELWLLREAHPDWRKVLFGAANRTLRKVLKAEPGIVMVLHPYGKDLKVNYHLHVLVTEGGLTPSGEWGDQSYVKYAALRKIWQYECLTALREVMPNEPPTARLVDHLFRTYTKGFYVYAKPRIDDGKGISRYIGRYLRHPAIANARILAYDGLTVTFYYDDHNGTRHRQTWPVLVFIHGVVRHIPPKHFKMVRYFGLYAPHQTASVLAFLQTMPRMVTQVVQRLSWRNRIQRDFGHDPLRCPRCGQSAMVLYSLTVLWQGQLKTFGGLQWLFQRGFLRTLVASPPPQPLVGSPSSLYQIGFAF